MSTRCQIGFYEKEVKDLRKWEALIYRHCDGYPDTDNGVIEAIMPILKKFNEVRGDDPEYKSARALQYLTNVDDLSCIEYENGFTGYGISNSFHGDIEYYYAVYPHEVKVYECHYDSKPDKWQLKDTIKY